LRGDETNSDFITLARVIKTQGRHGEVAAEVHSDIPDRFAAGMKLLALPASRSARRDPERAAKAERVEEGEDRRELLIEDLWPHKGLLVLKFRGVDSISDAESLVGAELQVPRAERAPLEQGWNYVSDLIGCVVIDHGREIGRIEDVQFGAGEAPTLAVEGEGGKKFDVPFAEAYLEGVDIKRQEVRMHLPDGMLEINAPMTADEKQRQALEGFGKGTASSRAARGRKRRGL
jgi:16S rRNA processing protein RimM